MHVENFKVFCDLVESKSFSKAAKTNRITQSAVSQQLRALEKDIEAPIMDRSQKQFRLTPEGEIFYRGAQAILHEFERLRCEIQEARQVVCGRLLVSSVYSIGLHALSPFLKAFIQKYPQVDTRVEYRRSNLVYEDVIEDIADLGLVAYPQKTRPIEAVPFMEDRLTVICAPGHPLAQQTSVALKDMVGYKLVGFDADIPTRKATDDFLRQAKVEIEPVLTFDNIETMKRAVEVDMGIAIVPASTIAEEIRLKTLVAVEIKGKPLIRPLAIIYRKGRI
jgi:DNA-binding transcriptional LysR family regulator